MVSVCHSRATCRSQVRGRDDLLAAKRLDAALNTQQVSRRRRSYHRDVKPASKRRPAVACWHEADSSARQHHFRFEVNCGPDCIGRWRVRRSRGRAEQLLGWHKPNLEPVLRQNPFRSSAAQGRRPAARPRLSLFKAGSHPPSTGRTGRCSTAARGRRRPAEVEA
jgi:hypothetical protein